MRDGASCQQPVIIGSLPGYPIETANAKFGFYDPNSKFPRDVYAPDTNRLAVNEKVIVAGKEEDANPS